MDAERLRLHILALCERTIADVERERVSGVDRGTLETHKLGLLRLAVLSIACLALATNNNEEV